MVSHTLDGETMEGRMWAGGGGVERGLVGSPRQEKQSAKFFLNFRQSWKKEVRSCRDNFIKTEKERKNKTVKERKKERKNERKKERKKDRRKKERKKERKPTIH